MDWLTRFAFLLVLILIQHNGVSSESVLGEESTVESGQNSAQKFATTFVNHIVTSGVFPEQEEEDMKEFVETLSIAISSLTNSKWASRAKVEALSMAFASAIAEIVVIEDEVGDTSDVKTKVIAEALGQAFKVTTGSVNEGFIEEIEELIHLFAHAVVSGINEADTTAAFIPLAPEHTEKLAGAFELASGITTPSEVSHQTTTQATVSASSVFTDKLYNTLINDVGFNSVIGAGISSASISALSSAIAGSVASAPAFSSVGYSTLVKAYLQAISNEKDGASVSDYARAIATATTTALVDGGIFSSGIAPEHITAAVGAITSAIDSASGISVGEYALTESHASVGDNTNALDSTTIVTESDASTPGSHIPAYTAPTGTPAISISFARQIYIALLSDTRFGLAFQLPISPERIRLNLTAIARSITAIPFYSAVSTDDLVNSYLDSIIGIPPGSSTSVYAQAIARTTAAILLKHDLLTWQSVSSGSSEVQNAVQSALVLAATGTEKNIGSSINIATLPENLIPAKTGITSIGSEDKLSNLFAGSSISVTTAAPTTEAAISEIKEQYIAPEGTPPVSIAFAKKIYAALLSDNRFLDAFRSPIIIPRARIYLNDIANNLSALPRFNTISNEELVEGYVEAISSVTVGADARMYAQEIATTTALVLYENNLLTWQAVAAASSAVSLAINDALSTAAEKDPSVISYSMSSGSAPIFPSTGDSIVAVSTTKQLQEHDEIPGTFYSPPPGTTPVARTFGRQLYGYLTADSRFSLVFGKEFSLQNARLFLTALATSISSLSAFSSVTVSELVGKYIQVITAIPPSLDFYAYAQEIARATAEILSSKKLLTLQVVSALSSSVEFAVGSALESSYGKYEASGGDVSPKTSIFDSETVNTFTTGIQNAKEVVVSPDVTAIAEAEDLEAERIPATRVTEEAAEKAELEQNQAELEAEQENERETARDAERDTQQRAHSVAELEAEEAQRRRAQQVADQEAKLEAREDAASDEAALGAREEAESQDYGLGERETVGTSAVAAVAYVAAEGLSASAVAFSRAFYNSLISNASFVRIFSTRLTTEVTREYLSHIAIALSFQFKAVKAVKFTVAFRDAISVITRTDVYAYAKAMSDATAFVLTKYSAISVGTEVGQAALAVNALTTGLQKAEIAGVSPDVTAIAEAEDLETERIPGTRVTEESLSTVLFETEGEARDKDYLTVSGEELLISDKSVSAEQIVVASQEQLIDGGIPVDFSRKGYVSSDTLKVQTITSAAPEASSYSGPVGASDLEIAFGTHLYGTLVTNPRFVTAFGSEFSLAKVKVFLSALASRIHSFPQFSAFSVQYLLKRYTDAIASLPIGTSVQLYAQSISQVTASVLKEHNLLSWQLLSGRDEAIDEATEEAVSDLPEIISSGESFTTSASIAENTAATTAASAVFSPSVLQALSTAESETRITSLVSVISSSLPRVGKKFDYVTFAKGLSRLISDISRANPSFSASEVLVEGLLNALAATLHVLEQANLSEISVENSRYVVRALSDALRLSF